MKHTKEPWTHKPTGMDQDRMRSIPGLRSHNHTPYIDLDHAERIVLCVNACAELENPAALGNVLTQATLLCNAATESEMRGPIVPLIETLRDALAELATKGSTP